ncbi:MAG: glycosyl hydrolase family 32 [Armatimonadetes bacterium]|nr:glycosyl hydrolase family 32 [Armatimonadota bacterium]
MGADETLYNGIRLPSPWPPRDVKLDRRPIPLPPWVTSPPEVIPIDVGRQFFVDDFLIEATDLTRTFHAAEYYEHNPVLKPDRPWELKRGPAAMVFSDGVFYDPADELFKMWYMGGYARATCYAFSRDGLHWEKPELDVVPGTNIVETTPRDSNVVWLDLQAPDPAQRYKMVVYPHPERSGALDVFYSADGIHWGKPVARTGPCGDRTTAFFNPFRQVWVYSLREYIREGGIGRCRRYWECKDLVSGAQWQAGEPPLWVGADDLDYRREDLNIPCELYNLDVVAYESVMLGLFSIWRGQPKDRAKPNEVLVGFSRDGFYWDRRWRQPLVPVSEHYGDWNWANVQSAGGCCLVVGDRLYFYVSGRAGVPGSSSSGACSTGLAFLRRDGFASMDAGEREASLTTRPVRFSGAYLFVNVDAPRGELRVEVLGQDGRPLPGFGREDCQALSTDSTCARVRWRAKDGVGELAGKPVRLKFYLRQGSLYSFWVSPETSGASHGYVAAGGPGFDGPVDTTGWQ